MTPNFTVSEAVYDKLAELILEEGPESGIVALRIYIQGGGCSGFSYGFQFADTIDEDDAVVESEGLKIIIDPMSMMYLDGASIDYVKNLAGEQFAITNPNAQTTCGCGSSFSA